MGTWRLLHCPCTTLPCSVCSASNQDHPQEEPLGAAAAVQCHIQRQGQGICYAHRTQRQPGKRQCICSCRGWLAAVAWSILERHVSALCNCSGNKTGPLCYIPFSISTTNSWTPPPILTSRVAEIVLSCFLCCAVLCCAAACHQVFVPKEELSLDVISQYNVL
jgi:hypothetical protein